MRADVAGERLGALPVAGGVRFRVWSTRATEVAVALYERPDAGQECRLREQRPLAPIGGGVFEATFDLPEGTLYKFSLDGEVYPDPYARALPFGVHGPAEVVSSRYRARATEWRPRPLSECVIYELHVGTFTRAGTYAAAAEKLPELAALGVTAIELMPLSSFPGRRGWGYDGVGHFAPYAGYGTPDELRALIDAAHLLGLNVLLDVVYNHFGPEGNYLSCYSPEYFNKERQTPWGDAVNLGAPAMRRFIVDNARYWLDEFGFDGLRLDATHALYDPEQRSILAELAAEVATLPGRRIVIAEDETNDPGLVLRRGLDGVWADDFHHLVHVLLTGERDGYYAGYERRVEDLARCIERGFFYEGQPWPPTGQSRGASAAALPGPSLIYCLQNHDQVGNRALGERLNQLVGLDFYCAASALLLFLPMTPLLWMGQEWAASSPWLYFTDQPPELGEKITAGRRGEFAGFAAFRDPQRREQIPDPQAEATFERSRLDWGERERAPHASVLALYRELLQLRRTDPVLSLHERKNMSVGTFDKGVLWVSRRGPAGERLLVVDFGGAPDPRPPGSLSPQSWQMLLRTEGEGLPPARAAIYARQGGAR